MRSLPLALSVCVALAGCTKAASPLDDPHATVRFVTAEMGDVAPMVVRHLGRAKTENRRVMVYVGATWCEPCRAFHEAVERGELTGKLGALDLVSFDGDVDAERLVMAGYESQFIPAFSLPGADGRASPAHTEGSVKGSSAVSDLVPRLRAMLAPAAKP